MSDEWSESEDEDPISEARRFSDLLALVVATVPEIDEWWRDRPFADESDPQVLTLWDVTMIVTQRLFDDDGHPIGVDGAWPRLLAVIEVALELQQILVEADRTDDAISVELIAGAGVVCELTRSAASVERLLPLMGPATLECARHEIAYHRNSRKYGADDVDWTGSGSAFVPLRISPRSVIPTRRA